MPCAVHAQLRVDLLPTRAILVVTFLHWLLVPSHRRSLLCRSAECRNACDTAICHGHATVPVLNTDCFRSCLSVCNPGWLLQLRCDEFVTSQRSTFQHATLQLYRQTLTHASVIRATWLLRARKARSSSFGELADNSMADAERTLSKDASYRP